MQFNEPIGGVLSPNHYIEIAKGEGAELVMGGERLSLQTEGFFMSPALFINTNNQMQINREEVFGPWGAGPPHATDVRCGWHATAIGGARRGNVLEWPLLLRAAAAAYRCDECHGSAPQLHQRR